MQSPDEFEQARQQAAAMGLEMPNVMEQAATVNRAVYESYLEQDFSPGQALYLTACGLTGNPGIPPQV